MAHTRVRHYIGIQGKEEGAHMGASLLIDHCNEEPRFANIDHIGLFAAWPISK